MRTGVSGFGICTDIYLVAWKSAQGVWYVYMTQVVKFTAALLHVLFVLPS